jgi:hypothetical protein
VSLPFYNYDEGNGPYRVWSKAKGIPHKRYDLKSSWGLRDDGLHQRRESAKVYWDTDAPKGGSGAYSDRMIEWDYQKHKSLLKQVFGDEGQFWHNREPSKIELFLKKYFDQPDLELVEIWQMNNASSGYPIWYFFWKVEKAEGVQS